MKRVRIVISGDVQDVGFRDFIYRNALQLKLNGWVRNIDKKVEAVFEGSEHAIDEIIGLCRKGPKFASVKNIELKQEKPEGLKGFEIN